MTDETQVQRLIRAYHDAFGQSHVRVGSQHVPDRVYDDLLWAFDPDDDRAVLCTFSTPIGGIDALLSIEGDAAGPGWLLRLRGDWVDDETAGRLVGPEAIEAVWELGGRAMKRAGVYDR